jgi:hypothetical protein
MSADDAPESTLYADRDSINPRAFAVRHMIIEEVKFRLRAGAPQREALERVARGVTVDYDGASRGFVIALEGAEVRRLPLDGLALYHRGDSTNAVQERGLDVRHWDSALERNRLVIRALVDDMRQRVAGAQA